jgi:hypothetical protein
MQNLTAPSQRVSPGGHPGTRSNGGPMRRISLAAGIAAALTVTACAAAAPAAQHSAGSPASPAARTPRATASATSPVRNRPRRPKVIISRFRAKGGTVVTLALFRGPVRYRLHTGSSDPGAKALAVVHAGPRIGRREHRRLLAAFNGGFLMSADVGGYQQEGHVIKPLRRGMASLVIDRSGAARIGVWGRGLPRPHEPVFSVRQNLHLLVKHGHASRSVANWAAWGSTLGGGEMVARSAVGENAAGNLIFAGSMSASPAGLAAALVHAGARTAMELDINPEWVQLDVARKPGRRLRAAIGGQNRPASQYLVGWTRDFFTVLAR